jgi:hypothetical protein
MEQPAPNQDHEERRSSLTSLTRFAIGGVLAGYDGLVKRISIWETRLDQREAAIEEPPSAVEENISAGSATELSDNETDADLIRYAAIGMVFAAQNTLLKSLKTADQMSRLAGGAIDKVASPFYSSRILSPLRNQINNLAQHGQTQVDHWIEVGRKEEARSRALANAAVTEQVDSSIQYLTNNQEVQELVQSQSVGLVGAIVEETRERTVSADNFVEAWVRTMLRRPMRSDLPKPEPELRARATPYRRIQGKVVKK